MRYIAYFVLIVLICSCKSSGDKDTNPVIVSVEGNVLTVNDLMRAVPENLNPDDSAAVAEAFIDRWIKTQLTLRKAELNLTTEEKNVEQKLQDYRASLLIYLYQQKMLEQKHSPLVRPAEIEKYYNEMKNNFNLQENIIKGLLIKIPVESPNQHLVRQWYRSKKPEDFMELESYCYLNAVLFEIFVDDWLPFNLINDYLPIPIQNAERWFSWNRYYETTDNEYNYYLNINEYMIIGQTAPLSYVENRIKAILLNKKRVEFIYHLEKELYEEGVRNNLVKFN
ncbi:MAG: hypothetical protein FWH18_07750 [Marinilabiliaceae bacterium]|nr:hypothetical protein [Marinilabiliaceae bacterium]